jgi:hypothetical protein
MKWRSNRHAPRNNKGPVWSQHLADHQYTKLTNQRHTHIRMDASASDHQNSTVKWFNDEKGCGFITTENCSLIIHHQYTNHALISNTDASASNRQNSTVK